MAQKTALSIIGVPGRVHSFIVKIAPPTFLVMKLAFTGKRANIDFTGKRAGVGFTGKRAKITFTKVDC